MQPNLVHVDCSVVVERNPSDPAHRLAQTRRSLIKGGVTRNPATPLARGGNGAAAIGGGDFYKRGSPRGLVYLFRRRRRGRGGRPGGIRAISKGGRNTAIFIRAAGMQSRSGSGVGGRSGGEAAAILRAALFIRFSRGVRRRRERAVR
ncbi:jg12514 [Pararge aegeria aegeria]|uniref:Jg12514 protein n=1 Tax=Pararge aegeria aegeria TaxID=348720 RepID=A0A8S4R4B2_9NEOP|nr:jg12514 [Pararge aegeria aegeria]